MYKLLLFCVTVFSFGFLHAQTFNGTGGPVANGAATPHFTNCYSITVSGVGVIDAAYGLASVCLNITHPFDGDLTISLVAPNGYTVTLSNQHGSSGDNYTGTCFAMTGTVNVSGGIPPFAGTFLPDQNLGNMNSGQNADGVWSLCVDANFNFDVGTLNNWSLTFNNTPAPPPAVIPNCGGNPPAGDDCQHATPVCNFDGYCGNTSAAYSVSTWGALSSAFCGSIENNSFITFVASATTANFNVYVFNSHDGTGIQMFFFDGGCGNPVTTYGCYSPLAPNVVSPVSATGLTPGNTYYLMFDGWSGDVCDYTIIPLDGVNILTITPDAASICVGQSVVLTADGGNGTYNWAGPNLSATTGVTVTASPTVTSTYTVTSVDPTGACPVTKTMTITITNVAPPPVVSSPVTLCQGSTATALTATGTSLNWFTTATGGTASATAPIPSTATIGTTTYYVSQTLICGESVRVPINVIIVAVPAAPTVATPVTYCQGSVASLLTATGTGLLWYTAATGGTGTAAAPLPSTATIGNTIYYVSQTVATCEGPRAAITVTISATPAAPVVTSPISYCQGNTATALTATGTNLLWFTTATGGTGVATAPTPSTTVIGTTTWYVSQGTGSCRGPRAPIVVNVVLATPPPTTAPITYCQGGTAAPLTATGTSLLWYTAATGGTGTATAPTPSTATIGTTTYYVTQTLSCGESVRTALVVTITTTPAAPTVTSPVAYCQGSTAIALTATGTSLLWYTTAVGGVGSATAPIPSTTTVGNTIYYVSQSTGACEGPRAAITVTINSIPAAPAVTSPVTHCQGTTATALTATGTGLLWYTNATGGVGSVTAPTPSTATIGSTIYYVSQTINTCESPRSAITVTILAPTAAPTVTSPVTYCQGATATALTATGTALLWYTVATGGTGNATAPTPSTVAVGSTTYYVSQTAAPCGESVRTALVVNITSTPAAPAVNSPVVYCQATTATALTATGTALLWYTTATGGAGSATAPIPSTAATGNTIYYVSQATGVCEGPRAAITVTINSIPAAPVVSSPVTYCQSITATALTAPGSNLLWYTAATGGTGSAAAPTPSTATPGSINYYVTQTVNTCESPRASIIVTTLPSTPAPTVTSPISYCQGTAAIALTATGTSLLWYTVATSGTGSATAPTPSTTTVGSTTYYVSQTTAPCGESVRTALVVNITSTPGIPAVNSPVVYCQGTTATALTATGTSLLWYTTATGGTGSAAAPIPSTAVTGNTTYYVSQSTGVCEGPRTAIIVTVNSVPAAPGINPVTYCQAITAIPLSATGSNLLWYTAVTGGTGNITAPTPSTTTPGNVNFYVTQTINNCESPRAILTVTTLPSTPAATVTSPISYCQGTTAIALTATGTSLLWYTAATGGTGSATAPTPSTTTVGSTTYYVSQTTAPCGESVRTALVVNITSTPGVPTVNSPVVYCQGTTATALTAAGTSLLWYTTALGGTGSVTATIPSTATVGNVTYYVSQSTGVCEGPRAAITVTVNSVPAAPGINPVTYCQTITATPLTATGSNLLWYTAATGGTGNITAPTPSTTTPGNVNFYVTQTINNCESPRALLTVTTLPSTPAPTATSPVIFCQGTTATALTATGTSLLWYTTATGGTGSAAAPIPSTASVGSTTYYVSQTTTPCGESIRTPVIVTINAVPTAPTTSPLTICQAATTGPLTATGSNLLWYTTASGGTGVSSMSPNTTNVGNTTYYVSQTVATCEGPRAPLIVTIVALPPAPIGSGPFTYCQGTTAAQLTATGVALHWYTVPTGGTGSATAPIPSTATAGTFTFYVTQSMSCGESVRTPVVVTINPTPQAPSVTSPVTYCQGTATVALTATGSSLLWYSGATGGTGNPVAPVPSSVNVDNSIYYVSSTLGVCEGPRAPLTVIINSTPAAPAVGGSVTYCQASVAPPLSATGTNILWYNSPAGGVGSTNAPANYTGIVGNTIYYCSQTTGVCEGPRTAINVTINPYPNFGPNQQDTVCFGDSVNLSAKFNTIGYTIKWTLEGLEVTTPEAVKETGVYQLEATNSFGCSDTVLVVVKIQPLVPAFAGGDTTAVKGVPHMLLGSGGATYLWSPTYPLNASDAQYPLATLDHDQLFTLTVTDIAGCIGTDKVFVKVYDGPTYYIPNAFTPNGDGLNDIFRVVPVGIVYTDYFKIFNRYGQLVFETNEWMKGWDGSFKGKKQPLGNYVWVIKGLDKYGKVIERKGTVLLVQ